ncbi:MAG: gamma-glutamyl-gamma-aminobutyrate hydrolase family protein [Veillonellaceae bacterium]|nr:gamma-glutamyl-gamma-aminobutyrate hydrolase family protein [Veillonellaceae bacterium]
MKKPIIGISGNHMIDSGGLFPGYHRSYVNDDYIRSIVEAGGVPLILPFMADDEVAVSMMQVVDGLLLNGGDDVYPLNYGEDQSLS